jgi:hypothetical protein
VGFKWREARRSRSSWLVVRWHRLPPVASHQQVMDNATVADGRKQPNVLAHCTRTMPVMKKTPPTPPPHPHPTPPTAHLVSVVARECLSHGCVERVAVTGVDLEGGLVGEQTGGLDADGHVGYHEGDGLNEGGEGCWKRGAGAQEPIVWVG